MYRWDMKHKMSVGRRAFLKIAVINLAGITFAGCSRENTTPTAQPTLTQPPVPSAAPTRPLPSATVSPPTSTPTVISSATFTPTPSATPLPTLIPHAAIEPENAKTLVQIRQVGSLGGWRMAWSPDGRWIVTGDDTGVLIYEVESKKLTRTIPLEGGLLGVQFSTDGKVLLATSLANQGIVIDTASWKVIQTFKQYAEVKDYCSGNEFLTSFYAAKMGPVIACTNLQLQALVTHLIYPRWLVVVNPSRTMAAVPGGYDNADLYELPSGKHLKSLQMPNVTFQVQVDDLVFSPDERTLAWGNTQGDIRFWNIENGEQVHTVNIGRQVQGLVFDQTGTRLGVTSSVTTAIINLQDGYSIEALGTESPGSVASVGFHPNGRLLISGAYNDRARIWNTQTWEEENLNLEQPANVYLAAFSPDGKYAAGKVFNVNRLYIWDASTGRVIHNLASGRDTARSGFYEARMEALAFSPDGKRLACTNAEWEKDQSAYTALGATIRIWDVESGKMVSEMAGHASQKLIFAQNICDSLVFSGDGRLIYSAGFEDPWIRAWDVESGKMTGEIRKDAHPVQGMALSPDGKLLATISRDLFLRVWDLEKQQYVFTRPIPDADNETPSQVLFSRDGRLVFSASSVHHGDTAICTWEIPSGKLLKTIQFKNRRRGYEMDAGLVMALSPDGGMLVSGGKEEILRAFTAA